MAQTTGGRQKAADRRQKKSDGRQKKSDGRQKAAEGSLQPLVIVNGRIVDAGLGEGFAPLYAGAALATMVLAALVA